jgi:hypothetical protein
VLPCMNMISLNCRAITLIPLKFLSLMLCECGFKRYVTQVTVKETHYLPKEKKYTIEKRYSCVYADGHIN